MIWWCISYHGAGSLVKVDGNISSEMYISILDENLFPVIAKHFTNGNHLFQDDNVPCH